MSEATSGAGPDIRPNTLTILLIVAATRTLLFQDEDVGVGAFPEREEAFVSATWKTRTHAAVLTPQVAWVYD